MTALKELLVVILGLPLQLTMITTVIFITNMFMMICCAFACASQGNVGVNQYVSVAWAAPLVCARGRAATLATSRSKLNDFGSVLALAELWPTLVESWPNLADYVPSLAEFCVEVGPNLADPGPNFVKFCRIRPAPRLARAAPSPHFVPDLGLAVRRQPVSPP